MVLKTFPCKSNLKSEGLLMESDSDKVINNDNCKMDMKVDIKEDPVCSNGTLTQVKSEFGEFETVFVPSHVVKECNGVCKTTEIKEESCWPASSSTEIKQEMELPSPADVDLKNEIKETTEVITRNVAAEESSRFHAESMCRNVNSISPHPTSSNLEENSGQDITEESQLFEEPETLVSNVKSSRSVCDGKIPHTCETCGKSFNFLYDLKYHVTSVHEGLRPHKCEICNKTFTKGSHLNRHKLIHGERLYTCEVCNKSFARKTDMNMHKLAHEGVRRYECQICNKTFNWASNLKDHKKTHEGKKPYTCDICNKSFTQITTLKRHKLGHEGKRPYICDICNKSFTIVSLLKQHKLIHGEKHYPCEICKKRFNRAGHLKVHMMIHRKGAQTAKF